MKNQRGQSVVEFAFVIPLFILLLFGLIYGGIMFLQYFNLCNDARAEARRIAVMTPALRNTYFGAADESQYPTESNPKVVTNDDRKSEKLTTFGTFYTVQQKIWVTTTEPDAEGKTTPEDVIVRVEFNRNNDDLPRILTLFNWPPKEFVMSYRMQIERDNSED